jgi:hypothetical protein
MLFYLQFVKPSKTLADILHVMLQARIRLTTLREASASADEELSLDSSAAFLATSCYDISQVHFCMLAGRVQNDGEVESKTGLPWVSAGIGGPCHL